MLRVRFNRVRFHAKARSREVKTLVYFGLALLAYRAVLQMMGRRIRLLFRIFFSPLRMQSYVTAAFLMTG